MERRGWGNQRDPEQQRWTLPLLATLKSSLCEAMGSIHRLELRQLQKEHQGPQVCPLSGEEPSDYAAGVMEFPQSRLFRQ